MKTTLIKEQVIDYLIKQGYSDPDEPLVEGLMNAGDEQQFYDEAVKNNYNIYDVDRWLHLMRVLKEEFSFDTAMKINCALWDENIESLEVGYPVEENKLFLIHVSEIYGTDIVVSAKDGDSAVEYVENLCNVGEIDVMNPRNFGSRTVEVTMNNISRDTAKGYPTYYAQGD